jgi:hypothetical protein
MTVGEATRQYQCALEAWRSDPDDEDVQRELSACYQQLTRVWIAGLFSAGSPGNGNSEPAAF